MTQANTNDNRALIWDFESIMWDSTPKGGELCYVRPYTTEEIARHAKALSPTDIMRVEGQSVKISARYDYQGDPLKPWLDALLSRLPKIGHAYSGTVYSVTDQEWEEIAAVVRAREAEDQERKLARERAAAEAEQQRLDNLRKSALVVSVARSQFDLGVRSARGFGGKYDGLNKTWTIPAGRVEVTELPRYGLYLAEFVKCWECGRSVTYAACRAGGGNWDDNYCGC